MFRAALALIWVSNLVQKIPWTVHVRLILADTDGPQAGCGSYRMTRKEALTALLKGLGIMEATKQLHELYDPEMIGNYTALRLLLKKLGDWEEMDCAQLVAEQASRRLSWLYELTSAESIILKLMKMSLPEDS